MRRGDWEKSLKRANFAIDFDGTVVENEYPRVGKERDCATEVLLEMHGAGHGLILWTCRTGVELEDAVNWCRSQGLEFDAVCENTEDVKRNYTDSRKIVATHYVDDRNAPHGFPGWPAFRNWLVENDYL